MTEQNQQSLLLSKIAAYTEILVKDPSSTIFVSLAETYRKMGMLNDARQIISKGLELHSDFCPGYIVLARILCQLEDLDGSVEAFERALSIDEESLAALVGYARVKIILGDDIGARELLLSARHLSPADPVINKLLLSLPEEANDSEDSSDQDVVNDGEPCESKASLVSSTLAELYLAQGLTEKALDLYRQLSIQTPDDLSLRRRVKEVEGQIIKDQSASEDDEVAEQFMEKEADVVASCTTEVDGINVDPVIETLNRWLLNIQEGRGNV